MKKLGIAIYPEHSTVEKDKAYIALAHQYGFTRIFTCLLSVEGDQEKVMANFKEIIEFANELEMEVRGRDQVAGLPITKRINSVEIRECLSEPIQLIVENVKLTLEKCPPELAADLVERGMVLVGGGALIKGFDKALIKETGLPVFVAPNPLLAVCMGTGKALDYLDRFKRKKNV